VLIVFKIRIFAANLNFMEYLVSDSSSDSESDHEDIHDSTDIQDYAELTLLDDLRTSLHITDRDGWYSLFVILQLFTYDKGGGTCFCPCSFVFLSVC